MKDQFCRCLQSFYRQHLSLICCFLFETSAPRLALVATASTSVSNCPARSEAEIAPTQLDVDVTQAQRLGRMLTGPFTKTIKNPFKTPKCCSLRGEKGTGKPSDQSLFGSDASFHLFMDQNPHGFSTPKSENFSTPVEVTPEQVRALGP